MSKGNVWGMLLEQGTVPPGMKPSDFNRPGYSCISVWNSKRKDRLAVILQSQNKPCRYQVVHGYSSLFFKSLAEAEDYCLKHGFKEQSENRSK